MLCGSYLLSFQHVCSDLSYHRDQIPNKRLQRGEDLQRMENRIYSCGQEKGNQNRKAKQRGDLEIRLKEETQGRTTDTKCPLKNCMETYYCRNFLKLCSNRKGIQMRLPNNRGDSVPTRHLLLPNKIFTVKDGLHLSELLVNGAVWKPPNNPSS